MIPLFVIQFSDIGFEKEERYRTPTQHNVGNGKGHFSHWQQRDSCFVTSLELHLAENPLVRPQATTRRNFWGNYFAISFATACYDVSLFPTFKLLIKQTNKGIYSRCGCQRCENGPQFGICLSHVRGERCTETKNTQDHETAW